MAENKLIKPFLKLKSSTRALKIFIILPATLLLLNLAITLARLPYSLISANSYFKYGFYNTIYDYFYKTFIKSLPIALILFIIVVLFIYIWSGIRKWKTRNIFEYKIFNSKAYKISSLLVIILSIIISLYKSSSSQINEPNVILIVVDTLRADYTSLYDKDNNNTPFLKDFVQNDATFFPNAYANSSWTLPSFASLFTSQYPSRLNTHHRNSRLGKNFITMAEYLKESGYATAGIVSNIFLRKKFGFNQGFDVYSEKNIGINSTHHNISSPGITKEGIDFINKNKKNKFFLFLHYFDPHYYYFDHEKTSKYSGIFSKTKSKKEDGRLILGINQGKQHFEKEDIDYLRYCYKTEIKFTDKYVNDILKELKKNKLFKNSIIIFTTDHGEEFMERGALGHGHTLYNELIKVPMAIKFNTNKEKAVSSINKKPVSNIDLLPTLLSHLNIKFEMKMQGRDIYASNKNKRAKTFFSEINQVLYKKRRDKICAIQGKWKLILDIKSKKYELYNMELDPKELVNKYNSEEKHINRNIVWKLEKKLKQFKAMRKKYLSKKPKKISKMSKKEKERLKSLGYM